LAIVLAGLTQISVAFADATFVKSAPLPGSSVDERGQVVTIVFSEALDLANSTIVVTGPDGSPADQGDVHLDPMASRVMVVSLKPGLALSRYTVRWTSRSAVDGQTHTGSFEFSIGPVIHTIPEPDAMVKWALPYNAVTVSLGERLNPRGSKITLVGPDGARADQGDADIDSRDPAGATLRASLMPNARAGTYQVAWTAVAANDGSTFSGSFRFTLMQDQKPGLPAGESSGSKGGGDDAWAFVRATLPPELPIYRPTWLPERFRQSPLPPASGPYFGVTYRSDQGDMLVFAFGPTNSAPPTRVDPISIHGIAGQLSETDVSPALVVAWMEHGQLYSIRTERGTGSTTMSRDELLRVVSSLAPLGPNNAVVSSQLPRGGEEPGLVPLTLGGLLLLAGLAVRHWDRHGTK
jgi:methionine-rich copper-binding protein CopC